MLKFIFTGVCRTDERGAQVNKPCVFPFRFGGITYNGCTSNHDPHAKLWCSTQVDEGGNHIGRQGIWGYCREGCPINREVKNINTEVIEIQRSPPIATTFIVEIAL